MPEQILFPEWRRQNEPTRYPFADRATLTNSEGRVITEGTFLDAALYPIGGTAGLYLSEVDVTHEDVTIWIGNVGTPQRASGTFTLIDPDGTVVLTDTAGRPAGVLISETQRLAIFQSWGVGTHTFERNQSEFAATVVFPTPEIGVRGVVLADGTIVVGDVWLVGGDGVVLRTEDVTLPATCERAAEIVQVIRVDVVGDPLFRRRLCEPHSRFQTPRLIKTVRIVSDSGQFDLTPDTFGDIKLTASSDLAADTVLRIATTPDGVRIGAVGQSSIG